eukprot:TRINITY_DN3343_c0_g1_i3.p1 TRINITY_DN3343_c0_g1~~TRINITY_DN3343_c0_g1_i3.p1  ORF type:complete len:153 (-),score=2.94 TRINITY_DN3343_c0_g1_i3:60-518(-)
MSCCQPKVPENTKDYFYIPRPYGPFDAQSLIPGLIGNRLTRQEIDDLVNVANVARAPPLKWGLVFWLFWLAVLFGTLFYYLHSINTDIDGLLMKLLLFLAFDLAWCVFFRIVWKRIEYIADDRINEALKKENSMILNPRGLHLYINLSLIHI